MSESGNRQWWILFGTSTAQLFKLCHGPFLYRRARLLNDRFTQLDRTLSKWTLFTTTANPSRYRINNEQDTKNKSEQQYNVDSWNVEKSTVYWHAQTLFLHVSHTHAHTPHTCIFALFSISAVDGRFLYFWQFVNVRTHTQTRTRKSVCWM